MLRKLTGLIWVPERVRTETSTYTTPAVPRQCHNETQTRTIYEYQCFTATGNGDSVNLDAGEQVCLDVPVGTVTETVQVCTPATPTQTVTITTTYVEPVHQESVADAGWNATARSLLGLTGDGYYAFTVAETAVGVLSGLSASPLDADPTWIPWALRFTEGFYSVVERGVQRTTPAAFTASTVFKIVQTGPVITYLVDDVLVYTSPNPTDGSPLYADAALFLTNDTILTHELTGTTAAVSMDAEVFYTFAEDGLLMVAGDVPDADRYADVLYTFAPDTFAASEGDDAANVPSVSWVNVTFAPDGFAGYAPAVHPIVVDHRFAEDTLLMVAGDVPDADRYAEVAYTFAPDEFSGYAVPPDVLDGIAVATIDEPGEYLIATGGAGAVTYAIATIIEPGEILIAYGGGLLEVDEPGEYLIASGTVQGIGLLEVDEPGEYLIASGIIGEVGSATIDEPGEYCLSEAAGVLLVDEPGEYLIATGIVGGVVSALIDEPGEYLIATGIVGEVGFALIDEPSEYIEQAFLLIDEPGEYLIAYASPSLTAATDTYAVNLRTGAVTRFPNLAFDRVLMESTADYVLIGSTLYRLDGDSDAGQPIAAYLRTGLDALGYAKSKRLSMLYPYLRGDGGLIVEIYMDEKQAGRYAVPAQSAQATAAQRRRVPVGRGLQGTRLGFAFANRDGGTLDLTGMDVPFHPLSRYGR